MPICCLCSEPFVLLAGSHGQGVCLEVLEMGWLQKLLSGPDPASLPVRVDDANFQAEVMGSELPVLIDFWSATCAPCRQLEPVILNLAKEFRGRIKVCEADVATAQRVCQKLGVQSTPTVVYLRRGVEVERVVGFRGSLYHKEIIEQDLLGPVVPG